jgi:hypothetical protein
VHERSLDFRRIHTTEKITYTHEKHTSDWERRYVMVFQGGFWYNLVMGFCAKREKFWAFVRLNHLGNVIVDTFLDMMFYGQAFQQKVKKMVSPLF